MHIIYYIPCFRNKEVKLDETFWEMAFTLHCADPGNHDDLELPGQGHIAPVFLQPVLDQVILAGKSMELLHNLGHLKQVVSSRDTGIVHYILTAPRIKSEHSFTLRYFN